MSPSLAKCAPALSMLLTGLMNAEARLTELEADRDALRAELAKVTGERDHALVTIKNVTDSHNVTLSQLAQLKKLYGENP